MMQDAVVLQIRLLLEEFINSGDVTEAIRCLKELDVPHFHHELVYEVGGKSFSSVSVALT